MVVEITKPVEGEEVPMLDLFTLDGKTYQIPDRVRPNVSMKFLWMIKTVGVGAAEHWLGQQLIGEEGYLALINCEYLTQEQSDEIFQEARSVVFGERRPKSAGETQKNTSGSPKTQSSTSKPSNGSRNRKPRSKATSADTTE
jgi:hypothetical protein